MYIIKNSRVVCPNFGLPTLTRHSKFTHFVGAVGMYATWNNFKTGSPFTIAAQLFFVCK